MQGNDQVLEALNDVLTAELTAINQYFIHYKMCANWGYKKLADKKREESMEEMRHAEKLIDRILFLDGVPNMQRLYPVRVGEDAVEQHRVDLEIELANVKRCNEAIALARESGDNGSREMLEEILIGSEESVDWLEAQLHLVKELGSKKYLAEQIHG